MLTLAGLECTATHGSARVSGESGASGASGASNTFNPLIPYAGPAELEGYGPIDAATARHIAGAAAGWDRVLTHPISGAVLAVDRYRPGEDLKRLLRARDQHCRFPGCTRPAVYCDIDHTVAAADGGATNDSNLGHLCRMHHTMKHSSFMGGRGWQPTQKAGGVYEWSAPSGKRYRTTPSGSVRFKPIGESPDSDSPSGSAPPPAPPSTEPP